MNIQYFKEYSRHLNRDMEFKVYGQGGKPVLVFPCQNGRFFDWEGFGMLETLGDYLEGGKIQLFTAVGQRIGHYIDSIQKLRTVCFFCIGCKCFIFF